ncbi:hypothetical protein SLH46_06375 [Draconibacterium sp. IB214405]|uniref:hypothetical protein n=1 Tax=Draconibacterium sp. IB214405 TaxID=3097352 RepID=UPI002A0ADEEC|nr:hypothetical protein [Draconibacterium sp. IB214405]MDX8338798.1 hypothetical protein [Draconibacterium sp. IB214405]
MSKSKTNGWHYTLEILVVFIGITAGFILNNWREDAVEKKLENKYLSSFYRDVQNDDLKLDSIASSSQLKADKLISILKETEVVNKPLSEDLAREIVTEMMYIEWLSATNDTYEDIINSGNLNLISDYQLKEKISSYYTFLNEVKNVEQYYQKHMDNYGFPVLYKTVNLLTLKFVNEESYQNLEFTNMYLGVISLIQQNNIHYRKALEKNKELQEALRNSLKL